MPDHYEIGGDALQALNVYRDIWWIEKPNFGKLQLTEDEIMELAEVVKQQSKEVDQ